MLVLSRKPNERIEFPNLGITVEVLRVSGNTVRVGVEAPREVRILRGELPTVGKADSLAGRRRHALRNRLNAAKLGLYLLQKQLAVGRSRDAEATLEQVLGAFTELDAAVVEGHPPHAADSNEQGHRALVVEDNANERELLAGYMRLCGYQVDCVEDGRAALDYLSSEARPDLVLLDMQMPRMDGRKTISAIRCNPDYHGIKLFAVSGMDRGEMQVPLGQRGVDRWFAKPLQPAEFAHQLEAEMGSPSVAPGYSPPVVPR